MKAVFADADHFALARASTTAPVIDIGDELDRHAADASDAPFDLDGPTGGRMHYTSGTTGRPKGVKRALPTDDRRIPRPARAPRPHDAPRREWPAPADGTALSRSGERLRALRPGQRRAGGDDAAIRRGVGVASSSASARSRTPISCRRCSSVCCAYPRRRARVRPVAVVVGPARCGADLADDQAGDDRLVGTAARRVLGHQRRRHLHDDRLRRVARASGFGRAGVAGRRGVRGRRATASALAPGEVGTLYCRTGDTRATVSLSRRAREDRSELPRRPRRSRWATWATSTPMATCSSPTARPT